MQGKKGEWDRIGTLVQLLEEKVKNHPDEIELTAKLAGVLSEANAVAVGDPTGACHFSDGSCQELSKLQCIAAKGIAWDGAGTSCASSSGKASAQKVSKTV